MGKSASGKDTIYKKILADESLGLNALIPYTTRPIREKEEEGKEYHFVSDSDYEKLKSEGMILEERAYNTVLGLWRYFTVGAKDLVDDEKTYLLIGTLQTYVSLCEAIGEANLLPIYIETDDGERLERALRRERKQEVPKYAEMCRRFLADDEDFSDDKLINAGIEKRFDNTDLEECINNVKIYIKKAIGEANDWI